MKALTYLTDLPDLTIYEKLDYLHVFKNGKARVLRNDKLLKLNNLLEYFVRNNKCMFYSKVYLPFMIVVHKY